MKFVVFQFRRLYENFLILFLVVAVFANYSHAQLLDKSVLDRSGNLPTTETPLSEPREVILTSYSPREKSIINLGDDGPLGGDTGFGSVRFITNAAPSEIDQLELLCNDTKLDSKIFKILPDMPSYGSTMIVLEKSLVSFPLVQGYNRLKAKLILKDQQSSKLLEIKFWSDLLPPTVKRAVKIGSNTIQLKVDDDRGQVKGVTAYFQKRQGNEIRTSAKSLRKLRYNTFEISIKQSIPTYLSIRDGSNNETRALLSSNLKTLSKSRRLNTQTGWVAVSQRLNQFNLLPKPSPSKISSQESAYKNGLAPETQALTAGCGGALNYKIIVPYFSNGVAGDTTASLHAEDLLANARINVESTFEQLAEAVEGHGYGSFGVPTDVGSRIFPISSPTRGMTPIFVGQSNEYAGTWMSDPEANGLVDKYPELKQQNVLTIFVADKLAYAIGPFVRRLCGQTNPLGGWLSYIGSPTIDHGSRACTDVLPEYLIGHELGHVFGLGHVLSAGNFMGSELGPQLADPQAMAINAHQCGSNELRFQTTSGDRFSNNFYNDGEAGCGNGLLGDNGTGWIESCEAGLRMTPKIPLPEGFTAGDYACPVSTELRDYIPARPNVTWPGITHLCSDLCLCVPLVKSGGANGSGPGGSIRVGRRNKPEKEDDDGVASGGSCDRCIKKELTNRPGETLGPNMQPTFTCEGSCALRSEMCGPDGGECICQ